MTKLLCTLGPSSLNKAVISRLENVGVDIFRINLSHTQIDELEDVIKAVSTVSNMPICLDTEGAQIRTGNFGEDHVIVRDNAVIRLHRVRVPADSKNIYLHPEYIVKELKVGDILSIDFNMTLIQVIATDETGADARVLTGGKIGRNKAVTLERDIHLPALTEKDVAAIEIGKRLGIKYFALSFANRAEDVTYIRSLVEDDSFIISKIECLNGLTNFDNIASLSNAVLIDRGDLSRQVPIEKIPSAQKSIIKRARELNTEVYVATNLLESMVSSPEPTRAEAHDIFATLKDGADGLVLAAETAIGDYPVDCAKFVIRMIDIVDQKSPVTPPHQFDVTSSFNLNEPLGGNLIQQVDYSRLKEAESLPKLILDFSELLDCQQITNGTYSPLTGFMNTEELNSVLNENQLPDGIVWTLPILLQRHSDDVKNIRAGQKIALCDNADQIYAILDVTEISKIDLASICHKWFQTNSEKHPGVMQAVSKGENIIAGKVTLVREIQFPYSHVTFSPLMSRKVFSMKNWETIAGFHTRNPPHRAHEFLHIDSIERYKLDGLLITPVIGPKKTGDFKTSPIMSSYQTLLDYGLYPRNKVLLGAFATYSRYAGPREAIFTAICRKNMGCSHFIIGRDHTGVGEFYEADANYRLFKNLEEKLGIKTIFFDEIGYDQSKGTYGPKNTLDSPLDISGTIVRDAIKNGQTLPEWLIRHEVQETLQSYANSDEGAFL